MDHPISVSWNRLLLFSSVLASAVAYSNVGPGTTPNITEILTGRCDEYKYCLLGDPCLPSFGRVNCNAAVDTFLNAIRHVDPCRTAFDAYDSFLNMVPPTTRKDETMFWSGVQGSNIPQDVGQVTTDFTVLEETFPGYMAGNLSWCGSTHQNSASGLNFTKCPTWTSSDCPNNTKAAFWERASFMFAQQAQGKTFVVLNSQREGGAFSNGSVFARIESKNLDPEVVTNVAIFLIPDFTLSVPNNRYRETCYNGTVLYLRKFLDNMGLNNTCEEDPTEIMWLQCARFPDNEYCIPFSGGTTSTPYCVAFLLANGLIAFIFSRWNAT